jgi:hypothetical protein
MAIELSDLTFTEQDDVVPVSGVEEIINNMGIANTLAGNDMINGLSRGLNSYGFRNSGTLNTGEGNDILTGTFNEPNSGFFGVVGLYNVIGIIDTGDGNDIITGIIEGASIYSNSGIFSIQGTIDTGNGNDIITGITPQGIGIFSRDSTINTGDGNDTITGTGLSFNPGIWLSGTSLDTGKGNDIITGYSGIYNIFGTSFNTGEGNDIITGTGSYDASNGIINYGFIDTGSGSDIITGNYITDDNGESNILAIGLTNGSLIDPASIDTGDGNDTITSFSDAERGEGLRNSATINTGNGNDIINSTSKLLSIRNNGTINTGNGQDSISSVGNVTNRGVVFLGEGNDSITASIIADAYLPNYRALENFNTIEAGDGDDIITTTGVIYNEGVINTGNGNDYIEGVDIADLGYGIYNNGGAINTGDGNDSIIANDGFESGSNSSGAWFLGEGEDYIKGFGSGDFYGGNGNDTLELTPGTYTVGIWGEGGESPIFTKGNQLMITSEFEKLKAGGTTYDFASLTAGQIIVVA